MDGTRKHRVPGRSHESIVAGAWIMLTFAVASCTEGEERPKVLMRSPRTLFWSAPFPSDDGGLDLSKFPNPDGIDLVVQGLEMLGANAKGFSTSGGIFFPLSGPIEGDALERHVIVMPVQGGLHHPIEARFYADARPFGPMNLIAVLPVQGVPLRPSTTYIAVVSKSAGLSAPDTPLDEPMLRALGLDPDEIAGMTVFTTDDPTRELAAARDEILRAVPSFEGPFTLRETYDTYSVHSSTVAMPILFKNATDALSERARVFVTVPRSPMPDGGFPVLVFSRTGGGGDRPLIDRGRHTTAGGAAEPGSGPALELARAGFVGVQIDGPHGGPLRNPAGQDEQFLIFNFLEPAALRDNVMQSAVELILGAHLLESIAIGSVRFDLDRVAIMGHSMGATIAPLAVAFEPRYRAMVLSGAGGSWIENVVYKEKPLFVRPLAEQLLDYPSRGRTLDSFDPVLTIVQWALEPADPQVYAGQVALAPDRHVLMLQGIVDHYILPPIANALSLSLGLDLAGASLDRENAETSRFAPLEARLPLVGRRVLTLPVSGNQDGLGRATRVVVQNAEDGIEDGHEVVFQTEAPKVLYRCFLETFARGTPVVPAPDAGSCR